MDFKKHVKGRVLGHLFAMPFIWAPLPFFLVFDLFAELYQHVCFPIYGIKKVKRSEYIKITDRLKLPYLSGPEKLYCAYCGYLNGGLAYTKEIAGRTERYWCGIMHETTPGFNAQAHQKKQDFAQFGDKEGFEERYGRISK